MADITMPQLGETVTEGTITKWFKQVGDQVAEDEPLFEVSTDKVDSEVPAPASGYVLEILVPEGETVDVGTSLAVIGDAPPDGAGGSAPEAKAEAPAETTEAPEAEPDVEAEAPAEPEVAAEAPPEPEAEPEQPKAESEEPKPEAPAPEAAAATGGGEDGSAKVLSPVVRRLIAEHGLDPASIKGTGAGGRITRGDVQSAIESGGAATKPAPAAKAAPAEQSAVAQPAAAAPAAAPAQPATRPGERDTVLPLNNIRKRTGEHMVRSKQTSPHVYVAIEVDFEAVEQVRTAAKEEWKASEGFSLTYLPFIARAVVEALAEFPQVNATVGEGQLIVHNYVNLGIAVDLDFQGLIVPVVHDADGKRLRLIAREVSDLAGRARSKKLGADDITGGTFTITNPGPYGTFVTMPIINQPQVAILSTDGVKRRPVVVALPNGDEGLAIHSTGNIGLTWDHRAFDGAYASAFVARVKQELETRDWAAEL